MSYLDDLRPAQYTSPSGVVTAFKFTDLKRTRSHKVATKELPQQDKADTQDLRMASTHYPMECTIFGEDYHKAADAFWDSLGEFGPGILQHPRWGNQKVLPASIEQEEKFVEGTRCAVFTIDFLRVSDSPAIQSALSPAASIATSTAEARNLASSEFGAMYNPADAAQKARSLDTFGKVIDNWPPAMKALTSKSPGLIAQIATGVAALGATLSNGVTDATAFVRDIMDMMRVPSAADLPVLQKAKAFAYATALLSGTISNLPQSVSEAVAKSTAFIGSIVGLIECTLNGGLPNRTDAIAAAELVVSTWNDLLGTIEAMEVSAPGYTIPFDVLALLKQATATANAALIAQSFALPTERRITLEHTETLLTLSYRLYGDIDHVDDLITWNRITGDEYFVIPIGRSVVWYG